MEALTKPYTQWLTERLTRQLFEPLLARLVEHYMPMAECAVVNVVLSDVEEVHWRFSMHTSINLSTLYGGPSLSAGLDPSKRTRLATLTLSRALLTTILAHPTTFDARSPASFALGGVSITGDALLAGLWLQLLKRPSEQQRASIKRASARAPQSLRSVPQWAGPCVNEEELFGKIGNSLASSTPLHLRRVLDWPEVQWTLRDWCEQEGSTTLPILSNQGYAHLADFIGVIQRSGGHEDARDTYTQGCLLPAAWETRFQMPALPAGMLTKGQLWFGRQDLRRPVTAIHADLANSVLAQVHGRKKVRLYAPSQAHAVYAVDTFNSYRPCLVDVAEPDLFRFPGFAQANGVDVVLEPGDMLIIPTGWFHCVWALDHVLSVSRCISDETLAYWWANR